MSSSSLSNATVSVGVSIAATALAEVSAIAGLPTVVTVILVGIGLVAGIAAIIFVNKASAELKRTAKVCARVDAGDFESRVLHIVEGGAIGELQHSLNGMIDRCDAYVRESMACLDYVANNK
ncbi:MAG: methyl-accepting chemotaxis protein, partial [Alphaproteobacteria bacterium]|nr:methyl-accepting chemotaxis protein [Alphaproteobacteria bacterium]